MSYQFNGQVVEKDTKIEYKSNPKRPNSKAHTRYERYQEAKTVEEYIELMGEADKRYIMPDLRHDHDKGFLGIYDKETKTFIYKEQESK